MILAIVLGIVLAYLIILNLPAIMGVFGWVFAALAVILLIPYALIATLFSPKFYKKLWEDEKKELRKGSLSGKFFKEEQVVQAVTECQHPNVDFWAPGITCPYCGEEE